MKPSIMIVIGVAVVVATVLYLIAETSSDEPFASSLEKPINIMTKLPSVKAPKMVSVSDLTNRPKESLIDHSPSPPAEVVEELLESYDVDSRLESVLKAAAMEDNTVILAPLNSAWVEPGSIMDFFLEGFKSGNGTLELLKHVIMVCLDRVAYTRCKSVHQHCYALTAKGADFSGEKEFMSAGFLELVWNRIDFLRIVLEKGYNFIFTDSDVVWLRNPFAHIDPEADFQISCDGYIGDPASLNNWANTGFVYVKAKNRSVELYKYWYSARERHPGKHDQDAFNLMKYDEYIYKLGVQIRFFSTEYFGGLCEPAMDLNKVCTMHINCCAGLKAKLHDLGVLFQDWNKYMSIEYSRRVSRPYSWSLLQYYCG